MVLGGLQFSIGLLFVLTAVLIIWIIRLELRLHKLLRGTDKKSLESSIVKLKETEETFFTFKKHVEECLKSLETTLRGSIQYVDTIRFNPFKGGSGGGNQSFATAFLNEKGDGVVISTIHTRERVGVFSKPLKNWSSEYELTEEEKKVIERAKKQ